MSDDVLTLGPRLRLPSWALPVLLALAVVAVTVWLVLTASDPVVAGHGDLVPPKVVNPIPGRFLT